jgi:hypothetical protein
MTKKLKKNQVTKRTLKKAPAPPVQGAAPPPPPVAPEPPTPDIDVDSGYQSHHLCAHCGVTFERAPELHAHLRSTRCGQVLEEHGIKRARYFRESVDVKQLTPAQVEACSRAMVYQDHQARGAIELRREGDIVVYVPNGPQGLYVERLNAAEFDRTFKPFPDYPTSRAARLFIGFTQNLGGASEVITELGKLVHVTEEEKQMALKKLGQNKELRPKVGKPSRPAPAAKSDADKTGEKKTPVKKTTGPSAATRFKELIMAGKLTDDQIFATVQKEFNLEDKKRSYVGWYRNALKKDGQNPPAAKQ